jgi:hypothetical protein
MMEAMCGRIKEEARHSMARGRKVGRELLMHYVDPRTKGGGIIETWRVYPGNGEDSGRPTEGMHTKLFVPAICGAS